MSKVKLTETLDFHISADSDVPGCWDVRLLQDDASVGARFALRQSDGGDGEDVVLMSVPQLRALSLALERALLTVSAEEGDEFA